MYRYGAVDEEQILDLLATHQLTEVLGTNLREVLTDRSIYSLDEIEANLELYLSFKNQVNIYKSTTSPFKSRHQIRQ